METNNDTMTTGVHARTPRLLLVDDEPMLQFTLRLMLEEFFEVVVADSGDQARLAIEAAPRFDVVLSDLQMPGGSGQDLYLWAVKAYPELAGRFVFMTGGAFTPKARAFLERHEGESLSKPFALKELRALVARWSVASVNAVAAGS